MTANRQPDSYISEAQLSLLAAIMNSRGQGRKTTIRSLMNDLGYKSPNAIHTTLQHLERKSLVHKRPRNICGAIVASVRFIPADKLGRQ